MFHVVLQWIMRFSRPRLCLRASAVALLLAGLLAGCDRPKDSARTLPTAAAPVTTGAVQPAFANPTFCQLTIEDREERFGAPRLSVQQSEPTISLLLFTDKPPTGLAPAGNRIYLPLVLDIASLEELADGTEFAQKTPERERVDSPDGILLEDQQKFYQPFDLRVRIKSQGNKVQLDIQGYFLRFNLADDEALPRMVAVKGRIETGIVK